MGKYIGKRMLQIIPLMLIVSIIVFSMIQIAPYNAVDSMIRPDMEQELIDAIKARYGYDQPAYIQYFSWIRGVLRGEFGYSIVNKSDIAQEIAHKIPITIGLMLPAYIVSYVLAIILGILAGYSRGKWFDKLMDGLCSIGIATPSFWIGLMLMYIFSMKLGVFPSNGMFTIGGDRSFADYLRHFTLPFLTLVLLFVPELVRYVRSSTIGQLSEDYVMVQRSLGATNLQIMFRHISKNVLLPIITRLGSMLPNLIVGSVITENVFGWPGIGPYFVSAVQAMDYPVVMAILLLSSAAVVIGSLLSDILYSVVDPRIKDMG